MTTIEEYRQEPVVAKILATLSKPQFILDSTSIAEELSKCISASHPALRSEDDIPAVDEALKRTQGFRDRVTEIQLRLGEMNYLLTKLYNVGESHLLMKEEIQGMRSYEIRNAYITDTLRELYEKIQEVKSLLERCELVVKNLKAAYDTMYTQHEVLKTRLYRDRILQKPLNIDV